MWRQRMPPPPPADGGRMTTRQRKLAQLRPPPVDHISGLPDVLLGEIISLLPVKDGGRTQALATRWRNLWRSAPLNLDCHEDPGLDISRVLEDHPGPARRFAVRTLRPFEQLHTWLRSAALDGLRELDFAGYTMQRVPPSIFRCSHTLRAVTLTNCDLLVPALFQGLHFPRLKLLGLEHVRIHDHSLQSLVDGCPVLEVLLVHTSRGFRSLRINSLTLRNLCVRIKDPETSTTKPHTEELIIVAAARLERLIHLYAISDLDVSVFSSPKEGILDDWHNFYAGLVSCSRVIQKLPVETPTKALHAVKSVAVNMAYLSLDNVVDLLRLFPCLEKLHVKSRECLASNCWRVKHRNFNDIRLKSLVLEPYLGNKPHVNFAKLFVLKARLLELMTFHIPPKLYNDKFLANQPHKLELENKVSRYARFRFTSASCQHAAWNTKQLHDLGLHDPFICRC